MSFNLANAADYGAYAVLLDEVMNDDIETALEIAMEYAEEEEEENEKTRPLVQFQNLQNLSHFVDSEFKSMFKMEKTTFVELQTVFSQHLGDSFHTNQKKLLASLCYLCTERRAEDIYETFQLTGSVNVLHFFFRNTFCSTLVSLLSKLIKWPTKNQQKAIARHNFKQTGFPGVVGHIASVCIQIQTFRATMTSYLDKDGITSVQLQAICDENLMFTDISCGWCGGTSVSDIFKSSPISELLKNNCLDKNHHLVGDSEYGLDMHMMVPYKDNGYLTYNQANYNKKHSKAHKKIKKSLDILRQKFERLRFLNLEGTKLISSIIVAACVLHNFILLHEDPDDDEEESSEENTLNLDVNIPEYINTASLKQNYISDLIM